MAAAFHKYASNTSHTVEEARREGNRIGRDSANPLFFFLSFFLHSRPSGTKVDRLLRFVFFCTGKKTNKTGDILLTIIKLARVTETTPKFFGNSNRWSRVGLLYVSECDQVGKCSVIIIRLPLLAHDSAVVVVVVNQ